MSSGFTVLELVVTLAIVALLLTLAVPGWQQLSADYRLRAATGELHASLVRARHEAILSGVAVVTCPGNTDGCREASWQEGWISFRDPDGDRRLGTGEAVLWLTPGQDHVLIQGSESRRRLRFQPTGHAAGSNATLVLCDPLSRADERQLSLSNSGRIRRLKGDEISRKKCPSGT